MVELKGEQADQMYLVMAETGEVGAEIELGWLRIGHVGWLIQKLMLQG